MASGCDAGRGQASPPHNIVLPEPTEAVSGVAKCSSAPWPTGMKVLVVDDDPVCLKVVSQMLQNCKYAVTTATNGTSALENLRRNPNFDLVLADFYMPDMDGFELLDHVVLELSLPVIMMSSNGSVDVVLRGIIHGAADYMIKPVRLEELQNVWQHVVRRTQKMAAGRDRSTQNQDEAQLYSNDWRRNNDDKRKSTEGNDKGTGNAKKARFVWSEEMHQQFVNAVNILGVEKAVPTSILNMMNDAGLTRENVASHMQKYRLRLRKMENLPGARGKGLPFSTAPDSPPDSTKQFFHHQAAFPEATEAKQTQQQSPLGFTIYETAGLPFPMGMSMQQHQVAMGGVTDQLVHMQMQLLHFQAMSIGGAQLAGFCGHLGSMGSPIGMPGGTAITRGLAHDTAPPSSQMPTSEGMVPVSTAEGDHMNDIAWPLPGLDPSPDNMGGFVPSAPEQMGSVTQAERSAAEMPTGSGHSSALHVDCESSGQWGTPPSSSAHSSSVGGGNGNVSIQSQLSSTTTDAAVLPSLAHAAEDDAGFGPPLPNLELFAHSLLLSSSGHRLATEEPSDDMAPQQTHQLGAGDETGQRPFCGRSVLSDNAGDQQREERWLDEVLLKWVVPPKILTYQALLNLISFEP